MFFARAKLIHGADGVNDGDISTANPLPIRLYVGTNTCNLSTGLATGALRVVTASDDPIALATQVDDAAFTPATSKVMMAGATFDDSSPDTVNEGDGGAIRMSSRRELYTQIRDAAGNERGLNVDANGAIAAVVTGTGTFVVQAAQSGTWNIGTVTTVTTVSAVTNVATIGTSVTPGTGASNLGKAVDAAAGASDTGVAALVVRDDALTTLTPADGDYTTLRVDSTGAVWVNLGGLAVYTTDAAAPASPVGLSTLYVRDDTLSTLSQAEGDWIPARVNSLGAIWVVQEGVLVDDAAFTPGTSKVFPMGCQADEGSTDSVDEGDVGCPRMTLDRKQHVVMEHLSDSVRQNSTARTPVFAAIDVASSGDNTIVSALGASTKIRVLQFALCAAGSLTVRFESGASGTALTGQMSMIAGTPLVSPFCPTGLFETATNTLLNLELSGATSVDGWIVYIPAT